MNHAEAVAHIKSIAPDLIVVPQIGNHVDVYKVEGGAPFSITLPDSAHLFAGKDADFIKAAEQEALGHAVASARKHLG